MRPRGLGAFLALALALSTFVSAPRADASHVAVTVSYFHDRLAPYGEWVTVPRYGLCWRPVGVSFGWQPYLHGEWIWTVYGWVWVSYDPWGGDPYHYGTWVDLADWGWCWIPGTIWAPAWVTWYISDDYCGWAPVPPTLSVGITGYAGGSVRLAPSSYVFVPTRSFAYANVREARIDPARNATLAARARPATRFTAASSGALASGGPSIRAVERATGRRVRSSDLSRARTTAVPVASAIRSGGTRVVAPEAERAKLAATRVPRRVESESPRASRPARELPHAGRALPRERAPVKPRERVTAPPRREHEAAPRREAHRVERVAPAPPPRAEARRPERLPNAGRVVPPERAPVRVPERVVPPPAPRAVPPAAARPPHPERKEKKGAQNR